MSLPPKPQKPIPTFSRVRYLQHKRPENLEEIVQSGSNMFNNNTAEVVNFGPYNALANIEQPRANVRAGLVTPKKGKHAMNVFGVYGELPSESGRLLKAPGAPVKKRPSERTRRTLRRARKTRRRN